MLQTYAVPRIMGTAIQVSSPQGNATNLFPQLLYRYWGIVSSPQGNATNLPCWEDPVSHDVWFQVPKGMLQTVFCERR